jgi:hypothetical protein
VKEAHGETLAQTKKNSDYFTIFVKFIFCNIKKNFVYCPACHPTKHFKMVNCEDYFKLKINVAAISKVCKYIYP